MTIYEKYYAMNRAVISFLAARGSTCKVYKYGAVPTDKKYPYIQTTFRVKRRQPHGSSESGTLTDFEYSLNFFTAAKHERQNDAALFLPFEAVRDAIISPLNSIWRDIANVYDHNETPEFNYKGGIEVLQKGLIFDCQTVVTHAVIDEYSEAPIDEAVDAVASELHYG